MLDEHYDTDIFTEPTIKGKLGTNAMKAQRHLYDHIVYDSTNERDFVDIMEDLEVTPSLSQAVKLKDLSASHRLDPDTMYEVMEKPKANQRETVKLDADTLRRFFPDYTPKQMETAILRMLEEAERERQRQKILHRSRDDAR